MIESKELLKELTFLKGRGSEFKIYFAVPEEVNSTTLKQL